MVLLSWSKRTQPQCSASLVVAGIWLGGLAERSKVKADLMSLVILQSRDMTGDCGGLLVSNAVFSSVFVSLLASTG